MTLQANWNYPTPCASARAASRNWPTRARRAGIARPLLVTDPGLAQAADDAAALRVAAGGGAGRGDVLRRQAQSGRGERRGRRRGVARGQARRRRRLRRRLGARRRQGDRLHGRADAADVGFRGIGDWWTRADPKGIAPVDRGADDGRHRLGSRPRRRHHRRGDPHQEDHLPPEDDAEGDDLRSGADGRHAAA